MATTPTPAPAPAAKAPAAPGPAPATRVHPEIQLQRDLIDFAYAGSGAKRWHITRLCMYRTLANRLAAADGPGRRCLCVSGSQGLARHIGYRQATLESADYPAVSMTDLPFPDASFDAVLSDQVLEHVAGDPFKAVAESIRVLKPGGHAVHTTCFINEVHGAPSDFWRFTPQALELLGTTAGAEVVLAGGWGNRAAQRVIDLGYRMMPVPEAASNPIYQIAMRSDPRFPITTWAILRKPA